jgi:phage gp36-like protein
MFLEKDDLGSAIYGYQVDQITEGNDDVVLQAIGAAIQEVGGYLSGASLYDVPAIFATTGTARNPLILTHTVTVAKWYLVELCNADIIYEQAKERYDRAVSWLIKLSKGTVTLSELPVVSIDEEESETDTFGFGSRTKFNHE